MAKRLIPEDCLELQDGPQTVLREKRSRIVFRNPERKKLEVVHVDNCAIRDGERCDFLVSIPDGPEYFVELKGSQIQKAADQLKRSLELLRTDGRECHCYVVSTRVPRLNPKIQGLKKKFKKRLKATLTVKNSPCEIQV